VEQIPEVPTTQNTHIFRVTQCALRKVGLTSRIRKYGKICATLTLVPLPPCEGIDKVTYTKRSRDCPLTISPSAFSHNPFSPQIGRVNSA